MKLYWLERLVNVSDVSEGPYDGCLNVFDPKRRYKIPKFTPEQRR